MVDFFAERFPDHDRANWCDRNEIPFDGQFDYDLAAVGEALRTATYNYHHGTGFDIPVIEW